MKKTLTIILTIFNIVMCVMIIALFSSRDNPKGINKLLSLGNIPIKASETILPKIENNTDIVDTSSTVSSDTNKIVVISPPSANKSSIIVNTPNPSTTPATYDVTIEF